MQKITIYDKTPKLKPIFRKPARVMANIALTVIEVYEWVDERLFFLDDPWQMKIQYYGFLAFMIVTGLTFLMLCM